MFFGNSGRIEELRDDFKKWGATQAYAVTMLGAWVDALKEAAHKLQKDAGMSEEASQARLKELFEQYWEKGIDRIREDAPDLAESLEEIDSQRRMEE